MKFHLPTADIHVPRNDATPEAALRRVTHLCIGAHQDDIEIMAHAGIVDCLENPAKAFGGVVVTNGAGSPRTGAYANHSDLDMRAVRRAEQRKASELGNYSIQIQLDHPSAAVKQPNHPEVVSDLATIFRGCQPEVVFTHSPADKHDTHVAVLLRCLEALRQVPAGKKPPRLLGCEVWRDLDWLMDEDKVALDSGRREELGAELLKAFDSQISGGKRYDVATLGRRAANATFHTSHATDRMSGITWAMDLTPLTEDGAPSLEDFTNAHIKRLQMDVSARIRRLALAPHRT